MTFVPSNVFATEPQGDAEFNYVYEDGVVYKQNGEETKTELTGDELAEFSGVSLHGIDVYKRQHWYYTPFQCLLIVTFFIYFGRIFQYFSDKIGNSTS